ncbi:MAG: response regulator [Pseudomonadota bacterium]
MSDVRQFRVDLPMPAVRVVESDAAVRDSICGLLELWDIEAYSFSRGEAFLEDFRHLPGGIVLCAAELPDMHGLDVYEAVIDEAPGTEFALLISRRVRDTAIEAQLAGVTNILHKPVIDTEQLLEFVGVER